MNKEGSYIELMFYIEHEELNNRLRKIILEEHDIDKDEAEDLRDTLFRDFMLRKFYNAIAGWLIEDVKIDSKDLPIYITFPILRWPQDIEVSRVYVKIRTEEVEDSYKLRSIARLLRQTSKKVEALCFGIKFASVELFGETEKDYEKHLKIHTVCVLTEDGLKFKK